MKIDIVGASNFVTRMFEACGPYQWAREFLKNSLEAHASRVEFGIEWQAVKRDIYRRTISDDGIGMSSVELLTFFRTLGSGAKPIGGVHDNFGVGAKIASLPWNPEGVVVISYKDGIPSMIWIVLNPDTNEYELREFFATSEAGPGSCVVDPTEIDWGDDVDWGTVAPEWARLHGTTIVLLGSEEYPDTVLGNQKAGERQIKGLSVYLNTRFWDLTGPAVFVHELRSDKKTSWPTDENEKDDARRANVRRIQGARYHLTDVKASAGRLASNNVIDLDQGRVLAEWYLWEGERPHVDSYAKKQGYIAVRYKDELFHVSSDKLRFRAFGIVENKVQQNLTIIIEPQLYDSVSTLWGVHPDQSRNRMIFTGNGEKGIDLPLSDWGLEFTEEMPAEIREAISRARGDMTGSVNDDEYRKRLQEKFGNRWAVRRIVQVRPHEDTTQDVTLTTERLQVRDRPRPFSQTSRRKHSKTVYHVRLRANPGGVDRGVERDVAVDLPRYRYESRDEFENAWHLAMWVPHDVDGPAVVLNRDAPTLLEAIKYHQDQYPDVHAEEIQNVVLGVYGEVAVAKIAHSQKLAAQVTEQDLNQNYRSEQALTLALMGLLAEESVIAQRLGKLGRKKSVA